MDPLLTYIGNSIGTYYGLTIMVCHVIYANMSAIKMQVCVFFISDFLSIATILGTGVLGMPSFHLGSQMVTLDFMCVLLHIMKVGILCCA